MHVIVVVGFTATTGLLLLAPGELFFGELFEYSFLHLVINHRRRRPGGQDLLEDSQPILACKIVFRKRDLII